jgi:molecular chaperone DnaK
MPQIEVTFDVDANGILNVKAKDKASGKEQSIRIEASSGLTDADIKKMQADAEAHAEEDAKKKALVDEKNTAEMMIFSAEKSLKEYGDKIDASLKTSVEEKIAAVKTAKDGSDIEAIKSALEALTTEVSKIGEAMSKQGDAGATNTTAEPQSEEIKDAETKENTDNK